MIESTTSQCTRFVIPAKRIFATLMAITCTLSLLGFLSPLTSEIPIENSWLQKCRSSFIRLFDINDEANITSWYSSSALLIASALLFVVTALKASTADTYVRLWKFLAIIFLYLSLDETAMIHEMFNEPLSAAFHTGGLLFYPWVLIAGVCLILLLFVYARFLLHLPANIRLLFISSGVIFVIGAIGLECLGAAYYDSQGITSGLAYRIPMTIEEFFEMTGVAIFIYALMRYLNEHVITEVS